MTQLFLRRLIIICLAIVVSGSAITVAYAPQAAPIKTGIQTYVKPVLDVTGTVGGAITLGKSAIVQFLKHWKPRPVWVASDSARAVDLPEPEGARWVATQPIPHSAAIFSIWARSRIDGSPSRKIMASGCFCKSRVSTRSTAVRSVIKP